MRETIDELVTCIEPVGNNAIEGKTIQSALEECAIQRVVERKGMIKCPHCGESYYMEKHSTSTAAYYPPIYKDGVNINPDRNTTTTYCECMNCGKEFSYQW